MTEGYDDLLQYQREFNAERSTMYVSYVNEVYELVTLMNSMITIFTNKEAN